MRLLFFLLASLGLNPAHSSTDFYSQASQDRFVFIMLYDFLGKEDLGTYLEIGGGDPVQINNTYFFEKNLGWKGLSIDISENLFDRWHVYRSNQLVIADATKMNYEALFNSFPKTIDYLSLDVDGYYTDVLKKIPLKEYVFKVITIEHDAYRYGNLYRDEERAILESFGYYLLCSDVTDRGLSFEDWWIHPSFFSTTQLSMLKKLDLMKKDSFEIIETLELAIKNN